VVAGRQTFYWLASLVLVVVILHFGRVVLVPFVVALLLTFVLVPAVTRLERLKIGRGVSVLVIMSVGLAASFALCWMVEQRVAEIAAKWPEYRISLRAKSKTFIAWSDRFAQYQEEIRETFTGGTDGRALPGASGILLDPKNVTPSSSAPIPVTLAPNRPSFLAALSSYGGGLVTPLASAFLVAAMLAFMLLRWELVWDRMLLLMGASRSALLDHALKEATQRVSKLLIAQCVINGCFSLAAGLGLWVIWAFGGHASLPTAIAAGLLCGILRFVPFIGIWIGAGIPLLYTFAAYPSNAVFLAALAMFVLLEIVTANIVEPSRLGERAGVSPPGVLISTIFWTWLWGPVGLLLAMPLTVLLVVMGKQIPALRPIYILFADRHEMGLSQLMRQPSRPPREEKE
jgi:predicted PurR-regulated permease PerM